MDEIKDVMNPKNILMMFGLACLKAVAQEGVKSAMEAKNNSDRRRWCAMHIYDKRHDITYELVRPMTNTEKIEFGKRVSNGETVGEVLESMKLLNMKQ